MSYYYNILVYQVSLLQVPPWAGYRYKHHLQVLLPEVLVYKAVMFTNVGLQSIFFILGVAINYLAPHILTYGLGLFLLILILLFTN